MKKTTFFIAIFLMVLSHSFVHGQASAYNPNEIIINFAAGTTQQEQDDIINQMNGTIIDQDADGNILVYIPSFPIQVNGVSYNTIEAAAIELVGDQVDIDDTGLNYIVSTLPLDEILNSFEMEEYSPILPDCENNYPGGQLKGISIEDRGKIKVGIIDSGISHHENNIMTTQYVTNEVNILDVIEEASSGFTPLNGGGFEIYYTPPIYGQIADDENGHGTAVAGIIGGLAQRAELSPQNLELTIIKVLDSQGKASLFKILRAIDLAASLGLNAINISWSYQPLEEDYFTDIVRSKLQDLCSYANGNTIIIAGSGNNSQSLLSFDIAPAGLNLPRMITVGGFSCEQNMSTFSNFGDKVDISAPAENIFSPYLDGTWMLGNRGTSFSSPIVMAALIEVWTTYFTDSSIERTASSSEAQIIRGIILNTATIVPSLDGLNATSGVVNFVAACSQAEELSFYRSIHRLTHQNPAKENTSGENNSDKKQYKSSKPKSLNIYPNPFFNKLTLSFNSKEKKEIISVEVWNMIGEKIIVKNISDFNEGNILQLNLGNEIPTGMYLLKINQNDQIYSKIIIKE